jgi:hypothetical protein
MQKVSLSDLFDTIIRMYYFAHGGETHTENVTQTAAVSPETALLVIAGLFVSTILLTVVIMVLRQKKRQIR